MYKLVSVQFENSYRTYDYLCDLEDVNVGDYVRVNTRRGIETVEVTNVFYCEEYELELPLYRYKKVLGKADNGAAAYQDNAEKRFVNVIFNSGSYEYSYRCDDESIDEGDFVWVIARGERKIAKVVSSYTSLLDNYRPILGKASEKDAKAHVYDFVEDDFYADASANEELKVHDGYHDYDLDEDDWIVLRYAELYLPEYKHQDYFRCYDTDIVEGDTVAVETPMGIGEAVVKRIIYKLNKDFDEDWSGMGKVLYKIRDNPNAAQRVLNVQKAAQAQAKIEARSEKGLDKGWERVERHQNELASSSILGNLSTYATTGPVNVQIWSAQEQGPTEEELLTSPMYYTNPRNIFYDDDKPKGFDHNRMVDDRGFMVNGKWLAEHERNLSNPGSIFDSRGFAKSPAYEEALKDNFYLEEETGDHTYDNPEDYSDSSNDSSNDDE